MVLILREGVLLDMKNNKLNDTERWLSLEEISKHVGFSKDTIRAWIKMVPLQINKVGAFIKLWDCNFNL